MQSQKDIRRKIKAVTNIKKVTKAMETMASIRFQKASRLALSARAYSDEMYSFVNQIVKTLTAEQICELLLCRRSAGKSVLYVVFSSDKGLCGALNTKFLHKFLSVARQEEEKGRKSKVIVIGRKGVDFLRKKGFDIISSYTDVFNMKRQDLANRIINDCVKTFAAGDFDEVFLFYNHFVSVARSDISALPLLPLPFVPEEPYAHIPVREMPIYEESYPKTKYSLPDLAFDPGSQNVVDGIFVRYLETMVIQILLESDASENAARMIAMQQATINADDMILDLNNLYNKARQSHITGEIIEVVSSAEALK